MHPFKPWRLACLILLGVSLGMVGIRLAARRNSLIPGAGGYLIRPGYPPLIYVPDYQSGPRISAASSVLLEAVTGTILYARNEHQRRAPASTTKIMTALVALLKGDLHSLVTVGRRAGLTPGSTAGLRAGDRLSLEELLQGLMLCSGNDAGVAIAEHIAGSVDNFTVLMNSLACQFGAFNTRFRNPHGLPAIGHFTTAYDLALITRYALQHPVFARLVRTKEEKLVWSDGSRQASINNTNRLLWSFDGADGVKTGTTSEAGHCLVASATRDGRRLIAVVLHSGNRWRDAALLLDYGFSAFHLLDLAEEERPMATVRVADGKSPRVELAPRRRLAIVCRNGQENLIGLDISVPDVIQAPVRCGQIYGRLTALYDGEEVEGVDLISTRAIGRRLWWQVW